MDVLAELSIPLPEVSGLCVGDGRLYAIGDRGDGVAFCALESGRLGEWEVLDAEDIDGWDLAQLEAVASAGPNRLAVACEEPSIIVVVDLAARAVVAREHLSVPQGHGLHQSWVREANSRTEGVVLLSGGGVLAAKEKDPAALLLFGSRGPALPAGATFEVADDLPAGPWWSLPEDLRDISDLALAPDGSLALLSDQSRCIGLVDWPEGGEASYRDVVKLPKQVTKAEGVAWIAPGVVAVASDTKKAKDNLVLLAWP